VRLREEAFDMVLLAHEGDVLVDMKIARQASAGARSGPSPTISRCAGACLRASGQNMDAVEHALDGAEIRDVD
jgi:hypothetical protein